MSRNKVIHKQIIILSVKFNSVPHLNVLKDIEIEKLDEHITRVIIHYGYIDEVNVPQALEDAKQKGLIIPREDVIYFLGRESVVITKHTGMSPLRESLFDFLGINSDSSTRYFNLPSDRVVEIGSQIRL